MREYRSSVCIRSALLVIGPVSILISFVHRLDRYPVVCQLAPLPLIARTPDCVFPWTAMQRRRFTACRRASLPIRRNGPSSSEGISCYLHCRYSRHHQTTLLLPG